MKYLEKSFTVQQRGREATACAHGWIDKRGACVFCGEPATELNEPREFDPVNYPGLYAVPTRKP